MAKKAKTVFVCQECGYESPKWMGQCICGAWNSMFEEKLSDSAEDDKRRRTGMRSNAKPAILSAITTQNEHERIDTGISELNRVLGGGLVPGS